MKNLQLTTEEIKDRIQAMAEHGDNIPISGYLNIHYPVFLDPDTIHEFMDQGIFEDVKTAKTLDFDYREWTIGFLQKEFPQSELRPEDYPIEIIFNIDPIGKASTAWIW